MKNTILALKGTEKSGKSTTIRKVYEMLKSEYDGEMSIIVEHAGDVDIKAILVVKGIKIGIESQGDPGGRLKESLKEFVEKGCVVIICTTRTRGSNVDLVNGLQPRYCVFWFQQVKVAELDQETTNNAMANKILEKFKLLNR
jgi:hypothetical protein